MRSFGGRLHAALGTESTYGVAGEKKGVERLLGHERRKGTALTVIIHCHWFHWLAPFSGWRCIIRRNQPLLCLLGMKRCQLGSRLNGVREALGYIHDVLSNLHLFLSPRHQDQALVSSPSGNTESNRKREEALAEVIAACWVLCGSQRVTEDTFKDVFFLFFLCKSSLKLPQNRLWNYKKKKKKGIIYLLMVINHSFQHRHTICRLHCYYSAF